MSANLHEIEIGEEIAASFYQASPAAWQLANDIAKRRAPYQSLTLSVNLSALHLPDVGSVQVIVDLEVRNAVGIPPRQFGVVLSARSSNAMFPRFVGRLEILDKGAAPTRALFMGEYSVPGGRLGDVMDATVLKGIALESLGSFLRWFTLETERRVASGTYHTATELMHDPDG